MHVAVVGAGISGLSAAWLLSGAHNVRLFEKESRIGGHSNTVDAALADGRDCPIDTGFIVYNAGCYPNLIALFDHLAVPTVASNMSFAVSFDGGRYEYSGSGAQGLFGQPSNLLSLAHWRMSADIIRFFREAPGLLDAGPTGKHRDLSLGHWLRERRYSDAFIQRHILPMGAAIWSTPSRDMLDFPAEAFARFFTNHGLLQVSNQPEWRTVQGGSREYVRRLLAAYKGEVASGTRVTSLVRLKDHVELRFANGASQHFDACLLACHADEALALLSDPDADERRLLAAFRYARNEAVLHTDNRLMPRRRRLWSSWNYLGRGADETRGSSVPASLSVSYWMNLLQPLATREDHFVTLNPFIDIPQSRTLAHFVYHHPMFDRHALAAQSELWTLQGKRNTWFAGSYFGWGFHEDGLQAGLAAAEDLGGVRRPWTVAGESNRLTQPAFRTSRRRPEAAA